MDHEEIPNYGNRYVVSLKEEQKSESDSGRANSPNKLISERRYRVAKYLTPTASSIC